MLTTRLEMRLTDHDLEVLDRRRGSQTRSDWLRRRIHEGVETTGGHTHEPGMRLANKITADGTVHELYKCKTCSHIIDQRQETT